ncbi:MAG: hypothetical protein AVDCRST_MAG12-3297, partial [uncultured Rubrobacteraceae bacterium]
ETALAALPHFYGDLYRPHDDSLPARVARL